ncbi:MAG: hypothetical protein R3F61_33050 [Myxococcota bacterium]
MVTLWMFGAWAGSFDGTLFGKPFVPASAVGLADPARPGLLSVLVLPQKLSCADARALQSGSAKKKQAPDVMVIAAFDALEAGSPAREYLAMGTKGMGALQGTVQLAKPPTAPGEKGEIRFDLAATKGADQGPMGGLVASRDGDVLKGVVAFELCDAMVARPSLADTVFERAAVHIEEKSFFEGSPPSVLDVEMAVPKGWTKGLDQMGTLRWTAPDGITAIGVGLSSPLEPFAESAADQAKMQLDAFDTESTKSDLVKGGLTSDGVYASHWRYRWGEGQWTHQLDVYRQGEGWPHLVKCSAYGDERAAAEVFAAAEQACAGITAAGSGATPGR